jgi:hypothetical protein
MVPCAGPSDIAPMHDQLLTFDEFRTSHGDVLCAQREGLRDDARAEGILREAGTAKGWAEWPSAVS